MPVMIKSNRPITHLWLIIFIFIFSLSPLLSELIKIPGNYLYLFPLFLFILINYKSINIDQNLLMTILFVIAFAFVPAIYYEAPRYLLVPIYILMAIPAIVVIRAKDWLYLISKISSIFFLFEILAIISFLVYFFSILSEPFFCMENEDTRLSCLYGATMTNAAYGNIIRPSAIYDEPGAFSFIVCMVTLLRHGLRMDSGTSARLLIFGMITFSVAHFLFMILYFLNKKIKITRKFLISLSILIFVAFSFADVLYEMLLSRFEIVDGVMAGDNRSARMMNTLGMIGFETFFVGIGPQCVLTGYECDRLEIDVFDSNPFTLLAAYGILLSFPYYFIIVIFLQNSMRKADFFIMLGAIMLILQRPNVFTYGYAFIVLSSVFIFSKRYQSNMVRLKKNKII